MSQNNFESPHSLLASCAQEIATATAKLMDHPMIITDLKGLIIGASDTSRLGEHHEASDWVLKHGRPSQTNEEETHNLKGTLAGVTYPLNSSCGDVVGTLAITGNPDEVNVFAKIVKKQVEILLREQELLVYSVTRENSLRNLLEDLTMTTDLTQEDQLESRAITFGFDPNWWYLPMEINLYQFARKVAEIRQQRSGDSIASIETEILRLKQTVLLEMRRFFSDRRSLSSALPGTRYCLLCALCPVTGSPNAHRQSALRMANEFSTRMLDMGLKIAIGVGSPCTTIGGVINSLTEARRALTLGKKYKQAPGVYVIDDFRVEELVPSIARNLRNRFTSSILSKLREQRDYNELALTIIAWCESGFSLINAAKKLSTHRNTLIYRLDKIKELLGADPKDFQVAFRLYFALLIEQYEGPRTKE